MQAIEHALTPEELEKYKEQEKERLKLINSLTTKVEPEDDYFSLIMPKI